MNSELAPLVREDILLRERSELMVHHSSFIIHTSPSPHLLPTPPAKLRPVFQKLHALPILTLPPPRHRRLHFHRRPLIFQHSAKRFPHHLTRGPAHPAVAALLHRQHHHYHR